MLSFSSASLYQPRSRALLLSVRKLRVWLWLWLYSQRLLATFVIRAYVVVPKVFIAYACIAFLAVVGLMSIALDVVRTQVSQGHPGVRCNYV